MEARHQFQQPTGECAPAVDEFESFTLLLPPLGTHCGVDGA